MSRVPARMVRDTLGVVWHRHLGRPAALALVLLAAGALLQSQWRPRLLLEQARLAERAAALAALPPGAAIGTGEREAMLPLAELLPTTQRRGADLEAVVDAAQRAGLGLDRADYAATPPGPAGVMRVDATLPLTGSYGALRAFVADVLNTMPHAALESLQIERANAQAAQLQATARLTLFYREVGR